DLSYALYDDMEAMRAVDPAILAGVCEDLYSKFQVDDAAGTVSMTLALPWAPFIPTIAGYWSSAMDQDWVMANGGWDGSCDTWQNFYAMTSEEDPFSKIMNRTGPFKFDHWTEGEEIVLTRNDDYWRTAAVGPIWDGGPSGLAKLARVVIKMVDEWG